MRGDIPRKKTPFFVTGRCYWRLWSFKPAHGDSLLTGRRVQFCMCFVPNGNLFYAVNRRRWANRRRDVSIDRGTQNTLGYETRWLWESPRVVLRQEWFFILQALLVVSSKPDFNGTITDWPILGLLNVMHIAHSDMCYSPRIEEMETELMIYIDAFVT